MLRKVTAILFILIANAVLLVHAVTPHHHHEEKVCYEESHCGEEGHSDEHNGSHNDHEHGCNTDFQLCLVKQNILFQTSKVEVNVKQIDKPHSQSKLFQVLAALHSSCSYKTVFYKQKISGLVRGQQISSYIGQSKALRAPPIV